MNYLDFYQNAKRRLSEALLSMWASGSHEDLEYYNFLMEEEPLLAEPIFQSIFPWETIPNSSIQNINIFDADFLTALDRVADPEYRFPLDRQPYKHQIESWRELLINKKSIVVTSGTGSGKTECFMLPVLQDLLQQRKNGHQTGIQAIFLYPLNALINSQQKRMKAWCEAVSPKITFAIYNGTTPEDVNNPQAKLAYPEIISRNGIRNSPPQVLFTNPTMLEYMLVRKSDQEILNQSQGTLRWILLDETHTYSGSAAAELALQIRRILDAFNVTVDKVRFASTSATIGSDNEKQLKQFISQLIGKGENEIVAINAKRIIPPIADKTKTNPIIDRLRIDLTNSIALSATEIGRRFNPNASIEESLAIIDQLGDKVAGLIEPGIRDAILPTRAHYFIRSIGGIYVCTNPDCIRHSETRPIIGSMTTLLRTTCDECGSPLLELTLCNSCRNHLLVAEQESGIYPSTFRLRSKSHEDLFEFNDTDEDDNLADVDAINTNNWRDIVLARGVEQPPTRNSSLTRININSHDTIIEIDPNGSFAECIHTQNLTVNCPHCGENTNSLVYLRTSTNFLSRLLSSTMLEQAEPVLDITAGCLWEGRKYITFTDSRQGTAKSALAQNTEVERNWIRSSVFHFLSSTKRRGYMPPRDFTPDEQTEYSKLLTLKDQRLKAIDDRIRQLEEILNGADSILNPQIDINEIKNHLAASDNLTTLYGHISMNEAFKQDYLKALLMDQFGRRPRRANSPENMGFIRLIYPSLKNCKLPNAFTRIGWNNEDWQNYLKICMDFFVRNNLHIDIPMEIRPFLTQDYYSNHLYHADCTLHDPRTGSIVKRWPSLQKLNNGQLRDEQNRLILLLCAGLNIFDSQQITETQEDQIDSILREAWSQISSNILSITDDQNGAENYGYKLNFFEEGRVKLELIEKAWLCPVTHVPMDIIFRGYSPMIKGNISRDNFIRYQVGNEIVYPYFPYADKKEKDSTGNLNPATDKGVLNWIKENLSQQKDLGLWSDLHERILLKNPIYLAAEHSAQQNKNKLKQIEKEFNAGKINILSCSTTMEMGVDIGGISEVIMNNVPPKPTNYLQRTGRAGRRGESKAMAVTFCAPNPIGSNVINDPKWIMTHLTAMPIVKLESGRLIQRHINSFLLACFIAQIQGVNIKTKVGDFFFTDQNGNANFQYQIFRQYLFNLIVTDNQNLRIRYDNIVANTVKSSVPFENSVESSLFILEDIYGRLTDRKDLLDASEAELRTNRLYNDNSPAVKAISFQRRQLLGQNLIGYLAEHDFIPSAGIPTGIVDFQKKTFFEDAFNNDPNENSYFKSNPSLQITRALSEYAPGNQVVLNEKCYESSGILMQSVWNDARRAILQSCPDCGYSSLGSIVLNHCPSCNYDGLTGIQSVGAQFTEVIEPAGFTVDYYHVPKRTLKNNNNHQQIIEPILLNMDPWENEIDGLRPKAEIRTSSSQSEILYYNIGNGYGYAVCMHCGRAVADNAGTDIPSSISAHKRLNGGYRNNADITCSGNDNYGNGIKRHVLLGGRLQTDFVEIRFRDDQNHLVNENETIWSLGVILSRKLSEYLGINDQEISFGVKRYPSYSSIFIFDTAKGGAGYSNLFINYIEEIFNTAFEALDDCTCLKACTSCLIDRNSQWFLNNLDRIKAKDWLLLEKTNRGIVPQKYINLSKDTRRITMNLWSELTRVLSIPEIQSVTFFISNKVKDWYPMNWKLNDIVKRLELQGKKVFFALDLPDLLNLSARELANVLETKGMHSYLLVNNQKPIGINSLLHIEYATGEPLHYFSEHDCTEFSEQWGISNGAIYKSRFSPGYTFVPWKIDLEELTKPGSLLFEFKIHQRTSSLFSLFQSIIQSDPVNWNKILPEIKDSKVRISYMDIHLKDALGCLMILNLVKSLVNRLNIKIESLSFVLSTFRNSNFYNEDISKDFSDSALRTAFLKQATEEILELTPNVDENGFRPHWRELVISSDRFELIIRPNGGIKNGWKLDHNVVLEPDDIDFSEDIPLYNQCYRDGLLYNAVFEKK